MMKAIAMASLVRVYFPLLSLVLVLACASPDRSKPKSVDGSPSAASEEVADEGDETGFGEEASQREKVDKEYEAIEIAHKRNDGNGVLQGATRVLANKPHDAKALNAIAAEYIRQGKIDLAKLALQKAFEKNPDVSSLHANLGVILLKEGDHRRAMQSFKRAIQLDASNATASANLGALYVHYRDYGRALPLLETAHRAFKDKISISNNYAIALRGTGELNQAQKIYEDILEKDSRHSEATYNYAILLIDFLDKPSEGMKLLSKLEFLGISPDMQRKVDQLRLKVRSRPK